MLLYRDRRDAGRKLASRLLRRVGRSAVAVLALPRGGVPVGYEVARSLGAPLDVFLVRKLGAPGHEELAMGAIASGGVRILNDDVVEALKIPDEVVEAVAEREGFELARREREYRASRPAVPVRERTVILVDDGLATGASMRAAVVGVRRQGPARVIVAVPTAARESCHAIEPLVDEVVCASTPEPFFGVGAWYEDFAPTPDKEVKALLAQSPTQNLAAPYQ